MLGALAWQVTHSNEKVLLLFGGDRMGNFFSPRFSLPVPVCLSLSLSLSLSLYTPSPLNFLHRVPGSYTTCSKLELMMEALQLKPTDLLFRGITLS
jgi:hypothetical protein